MVSIAVTPAGPTVAVGGSMRFTATGTYSDNSTQNLTGSASWTSSSTATATVQTTGQANPGFATAVAVGTTMIAAAVSGVSGSTTLTVTPTLVSITVSPSTPTVPIGSTQQFTATGTYSDNSTQNLTTSASWTSSSTATATIQATGSSGGLATGVAAGSTTITATYSGVSGTTTLTVLGLTAIIVSPATGSLEQSGTLQFTATASYTGGSSADVTPLAAWTSSNTAAATVQTTGQSIPGLATGVAGGTTTITAAYSGMTSTATLTVSSATLASISVSPSTATVGVGDTQQYVATGTYSDSTTGSVTNSATWSSSSTGVATIETTGQVSAGLATGVTTGGPITITAALKGFTSIASLTVSANAGDTKIPLMDMTPAESYQGFSGGLYGNGSNAVPASHDADGRAIASTIQPLDVNGNPSASGKVVLISIGMSNAADEYGVFEQYATTGAGSSSVNHSNLVILNGAAGGITACYWVVATGNPPCSLHTQNQFDRVQTNVLTPAGVTQAQVQAVWLKEANGGPGVEGCGNSGGQPCNPLCNTSVAGCTNTDTTTEALRFELQMGEIIRAAKTRWPNLKLCFVTSRIYAGYATVDVNPEPYAYEYGFSVQWLIQAQINQMATGTVDPVAGNLNYSNGTAPWIAWGPYIWANGPNARSDGLIWCNGQSGSPCEAEVDFQSDGTHPDTLGQEKVAYGKNTPGSVQNLYDFFLNSPYTEAWFAAVP